MVFRGSGNMANGVRALEISNPLPTDSTGGTDGAHTSLLPKADGSNGVGPPSAPSAASTDGNSASLQNNFFGQFKGFSISPLPSNNSSPSKAPPTPSRTQSSSSTTVSPPFLPSVHIKSSKSASVQPVRSSSPASSVSTTANSVAPSPPPVNQPATIARPVISSPILDATTCTAKELISSTGSVPSRPAPDVPTTTTDTSGYTPLTGSTKPARPLSSPNSLAVGPFPSQPSEEKKTKESGSSYPTLTRLASFMMRQNSGGVSRSQSQNQGPCQAEKVKSKDKNKLVTGGSNSLPRTHHHGVKANKLQIDREALRNLEISNPIPQQDIDIPQTTVPVRSAPSPPPTDANKQVVMRAQSLRDKGPVTQRPAIPTFGSMRQPSGTKRPTSIPSGTRPTSPPPPRPPPPPAKPNERPTGIIGMPGYQNPPAVNTTDYPYDDCFNLLSDGNAPLANIDEESSPNSSDNIYAVIEESPPESNRKKIGRGYQSEYASPVPNSVTDNHNGKSKFEYTSPNFNEYKSPKPVDNSISAGSVESVGLLSEIVNEIQARNMESIYSSSTLGRKKKEDGSDVDDAESTITATDSSVAGSASPHLSRNKNSAVASSNSSLGTYVNANPYRPGGSLYSNLSTQTNQSNSPQPSSTKFSSSSSSSSSGYLSPTPISTTKPATQPTTSVTSANKEFSTFRAPLQTTSLSTTPKTTTTTNSDVKKTNTPTSSLPENVSTYKPYSSTLQRSLGPLAASFRGTNLSSAMKDNKPGDTALSTSSKLNSDQNPGPALPNRNTVNKTLGSTPASTTVKAPVNEKTKPPTSTSSTTPSTQSGRPSLHRTPTPPSLSTKTSASSSNSSAKPSTNTSKAAPTATINTNALHRGKSPGVLSRGQTPPSSNSPDVVSSCSVGNTRSPDVITSGKPGLRSPDVVGSTTKPITNLPTRTTTPSGTTAVNRSASALGSGTAKPSTTVPGNRTASVHSSFKSNSATKQPQLAPKPTLAKPATAATIANTAAQDKTKTANSAGKDVNSKITGVGRGATVTKSASDVTGNKSMPAAARAAASKLSHVASLQQKFETAAASEKTGASVTRTPSSAVNKGRPSSTVIGSKPITTELRNAGFKK